MPPEPAAAARPIALRTVELPLDPNSLAYVEGLYDDFVADPERVPEEWRERFEALGPAPRPRGGPARGADGLRERVERVIRAYRLEGHRAAEIDPLGLPRRCPVELDPAFHGITQEELDRPLTLSDGKPTTPRLVLERLRNTYCGSIGVQFMHLEDLSEQAWLVERLESSGNWAGLDPEARERLLEQLISATVFEGFMQKRFLGAKTFSLEGAETLVPLLELAIEEAAAQGVSEIVLGMAHRGRLNVLVNVLGQPAREVFRTFRDEPEAASQYGDVRYHLGLSSDRRTRSGRGVHLSLTFNPSHLEFVDPVVLGRVRAKQDLAGDSDRRRVMGILIHGDAGFAGEGIVQETLNLSMLPAYRTGGTLHVIVNNQLGFTTGPSEGRSSPYATDVAKMLQVPIFHVNGEDPEAVLRTVRLAMEFRRAARRDAIIDLYCYRRRGHNETDEPSFTQPVMYRAIAAKPPVRQSYEEHLRRTAGLDAARAEAMAKEAYARLDRESKEAPSTAAPRADAEAARGTAREESRAAAPPRPAGAWEGYRGGPEDRTEPDTRLPAARLSSFLDALTRLPPGFEPHPKLAAGLERRRKMAAGEIPLDWSAAEALALASLAAEGVRVRLAGQDTARGTFSQRHAVLFDYRDGRPYLPLRHVEAGQAPVEVYNSPLSEAAALGFEYGYSLEAPGALVVWEAQFGDFANAAQVIIDQFLAAAERKWQRLSGLVLLLPHGIEGQGPEHSSARLERFLSLAAEDNLQVSQPTTPAQYYHCLRRQALHRWRKPLVVLTPKSLLRDPRCASSLAELAEDRFERVLVSWPAKRAPRADAEAARGTARSEATAPRADAPREASPSEARAGKALLCTGKVYYELARRREKLGLKDVALVRIEQPYPLPEEVLERALAGLAPEAPLRWVQEEPANMGAWPALRLRFGERLLGRPWDRVSRPASPSPASGTKAAFAAEQEKLLQEAFRD